MEKLEEDKLREELLWVMSHPGVLGIFVSIVVCDGTSRKTRGSAAHN